jgi:hypothetical protein
MARLDARMAARVSFLRLVYQLIGERSIYVRKLQSDIRTLQVFSESLRRFAGVHVYSLLSSGHRWQHLISTTRYSESLS